jgi:hypothetical protein
MKTLPYALHRRADVDSRTSPKAAPASYERLDVSGLPNLEHVVHEKTAAEVRDPAVVGRARAECVLHFASGLAKMDAADRAVEHDQATRLGPLVVAALATADETRVTNSATISQVLGTNQKIALRRTGVKTLTRAGARECHPSVSRA